MRYPLTQEIEEQIVQYIRAGGFDWVAAEAAGVPLAIFQLWLKRGARSTRQPYRHFHERVMQARAQSRLKAEIDSRDKDARFWLRHGPGRERLGQPGWTNPARAAVRSERTPANLFESPEFCRFLAVLLDSLTPFPEARAVAAKALEKFPPRRKGATTDDI